MFAKPSFFTKTLERCPERGEHRLERERGREREREREKMQGEGSRIVMVTTGM